MSARGKPSTSRKSGGATPPRSRRDALRRLKTVEVDVSWLEPEKVERPLEVAPPSVKKLAVPLAPARPARAPRGADPRSGHRKDLRPPPLAGAGARRPTLDVCEEWLIEDAGARTDARADGDGERDEPRSTGTQ